MGRHEAKPPPNPKPPQPNPGTSDGQVKPGGTHRK